MRPGFCCCLAVCMCVFPAPQEEYKRGVSMWNFDVASLKAQAALVSEAHGSIQTHTSRHTVSAPELNSGVRSWGLGLGVSTADDVLSLTLSLICTVCQVLLLDGNAREACWSIAALHWWCSHCQMHNHATPADWACVEICIESQVSQLTHNHMLPADWGCVYINGPTG
jgi:hypothetical protein